MTASSGRNYSAVMPIQIRVTGLDHVVVCCSDVERSLAFYTEMLGLAPERVDEWRNGEAPFPSVRVDSTTIIDLFGAAPEGKNMDHICLVIEPVDFDELAASGHFEVLGGPGSRYGARGDGTSLYVRDPDGLMVELRYY